MPGRMRFPNFCGSKPNGTEKFVLPRCLRWASVVNRVWIFVPARIKSMIDQSVFQCLEKVSYPRFCAFGKNFTNDSNLILAPKLRNSFIGTLPESKSSKRPQSIISVSSSSSGSSVVSTGTGSTASGCETNPSKSNGSAVGSSSAVSSGCSTSSTSSSSTTASITTCKRLTLSITDPNAPAPLKTNFKKHQRSTTLVSQCSMGELKNFSNYICNIQI